MSENGDAGKGAMSINVSNKYAVSRAEAVEYLALSDYNRQRSVSNMADEHTASIPSSIFNLANTILGASTLGVAFACSQLGVIFYVVLLFGMAMFAEFSIQLLTRSLVISGKSTYADIGYEALGRPGELATLLTVIIQQLGACIAYVDIIGDVFRPLITNFHTPFLRSAVPWQILIVVVVIFPLTMLRKMDSLRFSSLAAVALIIVFAGVVTTEGLHTLATTDVAASFSDHALRFVGNDPISMLVVVPVLAFAFVCHMNVFPIYQELQNPSLSRMGKVGKGSILICFCVYSLAGTMGNISFQQFTEGDLLKSWADHPLWVPSVIVLIVRIGIGVALIFSVPVLAFELRHGIDSLFFRNSEFSWMRHTAMNVGIMTVATVVAILVPTVITVFSFIGATTSTLMVYVMPALYYLKIEAAADIFGRRQDKGASRRCRRGMAWFMFIAGCCLIPLCLAAVTLKSLNIKHL